jgi:hypothetical protein
MPRLKRSSLDRSKEERLFDMLELIKDQHRRYQELSGHPVPPFPGHQVPPPPPFEIQKPPPTRRPVVVSQAAALSRANRLWFIDHFAEIAAKASGQPWKVRLRIAEICGLSTSVTLDARFTCHDPMAPTPITTTRAPPTYAGNCDISFYHICRTGPLDRLIGRD